MTDGGDRREYKTMALPKAPSRWRLNGLSPAERTAQTMSEMINREASSGWRYVGADSIRVETRLWLTGARIERSHTVLVFERPARAAPMQDRGRGFDDHEFEEEPRMARGRRRGAGRAAADAGLSQSAPRQAPPPAPERRGRGYGMDDDPGFAAQDPYEDLDRRAAPRRRSADRGDQNAAEPRPRGLVETMVNSRQRRTD